MKFWAKIILILVFFFTGICTAELPTSDNTQAPYQNWETSEDTNMGKTVKENTVENNGIISKLQEAFGINYGEEGSAAFYISKVINYFLGILGFIALLVLIYGFYMIFTSQDSEESLNKAKKYIGVATLSIFIIGLSWYITSWIFYIVS